MRKDMDKKGIRLQEIGTIAIIIVTIAIVIAMSGRILSEIQAEQPGNSSDPSVAYNATEYGLESMETLGSWLPIIVIVIVAVVVISVIMLLRGQQMS
jgi:hypothetical protein